MPTQTETSKALNDDPDVDVIVIARGGGSKAELASLNDWTLAQTISESRVPVVTAIGHRQDKSLADYVADRAVPTPSSVGPVLARRPALAGRLSPAERPEILQIAVLTAVLILLALSLYFCGWASGWW
jgi:exodeoxyribonuclease VII large subunit